MMSYQEKNVTVSLVSHLLIAGYYLASVWRMRQAGELVAGQIYLLWATVVLLAIAVNIVGSILTNIVLSIVTAVKTGSDTQEEFIADERDKLIELKGFKISYIAFSIGVFSAMISFVLGQPPLIMFSALIFVFIAAEIIGDAAQIFFYRRGV
jgi:hypothetical protein